MLYGISEQSKYLCDCFAEVARCSERIRSLCLDSYIGLDTASRAVVALRSVLHELGNEIADESNGR